MHPTITILSWAHHMKDNLLVARHEFVRHIRSRHFWYGLGITILLVGTLALIVA